MPNLKFGGPLGTVLTKDQQRLSPQLFGELVLSGPVDEALEGWVKLLALRTARDLVAAPGFDLTAALADPSALGKALGAALTAELAGKGLGVSVGQLTLRG